MANFVSIVWFRQDLRLDDNPALAAAIARGGQILPVYIWAPTEETPWTPGAASRWWLHQSLKSLAAQLQTLGLQLRICAAESSLSRLQQFIAESGATAVFWNRRYEPAIMERDRQIKKQLRAAGLTVESFNSTLLFEPHQIHNKTGQPFRVFTPFWHHYNGLTVAAPQSLDLAAVKATIATATSTRLDKSVVPTTPIAKSLCALQLEPKIDWAAGIRAQWSAGEPSAQQQLTHFLNNSLANYHQQRDFPAVAAISRLSPYLHFGEISPRRIWQQVQLLAARYEHLRETANSYLRQLAWRDFAYHLLYHFPTTPSEPLRAEFRRFPWQQQPQLLKIWQRGQTGYPIVDAGMRQLWATGWMHNRVRMIVGSFLVKHLRLPWQQGAAWFWDTLVDADLANNTLGWQWVAGCGADAAPYFRIFNPTLQSEKFDNQATYLRHWLPELQLLPDQYCHQPHLAPPEVLRQAGITLGKNYPYPIVEHAAARKQALAAFQQLKQPVTTSVHFES
jgi:deoxyribodipyrimidine photo-lyase